MSLGKVRMEKSPGVISGRFIDLRKQSNFDISQHGFEIRGERVREVQAVVQNRALTSTDLAQAFQT